MTNSEKLDKLLDQVDSIRSKVRKAKDSGDTEFLLSLSISNNYLNELCRAYERDLTKLLLNRGEIESNF